MVDAVLVPIDGSPLSVRALSHVADTFPDASVHLLYALDHVESTDDFDWTSLPGYWDGSSSEVRERGEEVLADARETAESDGLTVVSAELVVGRPATSIVEYASDESIDLIVMGSHGREGLSRYILGSVAERVLRRSTVPVTIIR